MIGKVNRNLYKIVIWVVAISFLVSMVAVWRPSLIGEIFTPKYAVKVGNVEFSSIHYYKLVDFMYRQYLRNQNVSPDQMDMYRDFAKYSVFNALKDAGIGYILARRFGLAVTPLYLASRITQEAPGLLELRKSPDINAMVEYKAWENYYRWKIGRDAVDKLLQNSEGLSRSSAQRELFFEDSRADFEYAYIKTSVFSDIAENFTEDELKSYYEEHKDEFKHDEKRMVLLVGVYDYAFKANVTVSEAEAKLYYLVHKRKYRHDEMAHAYHILVKNETQAEDLFERILDCYENATREEFLSRFKELAEKYSQDPGSAKKGGDLGWFEKGKMVKEFDDAVFSTEAGQLYPSIVRTRYGYHIIYVAGRKKPGYKSFEEVKNYIIDTLKNKKASRLASAYLAKVVSFVMKIPGTNTTLVVDKFPMARCALTMPFEKKAGMIPGVGGYREAVDEIFSLKKKGQWTKTMRLGQGWFKFRLEKIIPPGYDDFKAIKYKITGRFRNEKMKNLAIKRAKELAEYARRTGSLASAARKYGFSYGKAEGVSFEGSVENATTKLSRRVFAKKEGEFGGPFEDAGKVYVFRVLRLYLPDEDPSAIDVRRRFEKELGMNVSKDYFSYYSTRIKVIRNEETSP